MHNPAPRATIVNHLAIDIAASPDAVWNTIVEEYVEARKFREFGYTIEPLGDPAAHPDSYRMRLEQDGALVDDRTCHITEFDTVTRRLSIFADYLSAPNGMVVYATYQAIKTDGGARYTIDCHASLDLDPTVTDGPAIAATVASLKGQFDDALTNYLASIRLKLEI